MAFKDLKTVVTTALVLVSPQESDPSRIEADSSDFAIGTVLSQQSMTDRKWHPVVFYSKSLSFVKWNYEIHNKEMLAIIHVLEEWRYFLEGAIHLVEIWTNHKNLEYFMMAKKLNCLVSPYIWLDSTSCFITTPDVLWANWTHCQGELIMETEPLTIRTLSSFNWSSLQCVPWKE